MKRNPRLAAVRLARPDTLENRILLTSDIALLSSTDSGFGQPAQLTLSDDNLTLSELHDITGVAVAHDQHGLDGYGQTVVIIDSGIAYDHEALGGGLGSDFRVVGGWDFAEDDADPYDDPPGGFHGSHVAGILASSDRVHRGVAPGADIVSLRVFNDRGLGKLEWLEASLQWTIDHLHSFEFPVTTINLSIGTDWIGNDVPDFATLENEFATLRQQNVFIAVAAGNQFDGQSVGLSYPAVSPHVVPVASLQGGGTLSEFSQRAEFVFAAPGEEVTSTVPDYLYDFNGRADDFYAASGTSMASPYLAGASVLVRQAMQAAGQPVSVDAIEQLLADTAHQKLDAATGEIYLQLSIDQAIQQLLKAKARREFDLGVISAERTIELPKSDPGPKEIRFTAQEAGLYELTSLGGKGEIQRVVQSLKSSQIYRFASSHETERVSVRPLLQFRQDELEIIGSIHADTITLDDQGTVSINGITYQFDPDAVRDIRLRGDRGNDRLVIFNNDNQSRVEFAPGRVDIQNVSNRLRAGGFETIEVFASGPTTTALFYDSLEDDQFHSKSTHSWMVTNGYLNYIRGAQHVMAWSSQGNDKAVMYDDQNIDRSQLDRGIARLIGQDIASSATNFEQIVFQGDTHSTAEINGSNGSDQLIFQNNSLSAKTSDFFAYATGYRHLIIDAAGGYDQLRIYDSSGDDQIAAQKGSLVWTQPELDVTFHSIEGAEVFSSMGSDIAQIAGTQASDRITAKPTHTWLNHSEGLLYFKGFHEITVNGRGGDDAALVDIPTIQIDAKTMVRISANYAAIASVQIERLESHRVLRLYHPLSSDDENENQSSISTQTIEVP